MTRGTNIIVWVGVLIAIVAVGIGSRLIHTGWVLFDKYLGDALYAAMVYATLGLLNVRSAKTKIITTTLLMIALECFQLTSIPTQLYFSGSLVLKGVAVLLGLQFDWRDLAAYAVGIEVIALADATLRRKQ